MLVGCAEYFTFFFFKKKRKNREAEQKSLASTTSLLPLAHRPFLRPHLADNSPDLPLSFNHHHTFIFPCRPSPPPPVTHHYQPPFYSSFTIHHPQHRLHTTVQLRRDNSHHCSSPFTPTTLQQPFTTFSPVHHLYSACNSVTLL